MPQYFGHKPNPSHSGSFYARRLTKGCILLYVMGGLLAGYAIYAMIMASVLT